SASVCSPDRGHCHWSWGARCTCTPPTTASVPPGSGPSRATAWTEWRGPTSTARATSRCAARPRSYCWPSCGARPPRAVGSRYSAIPPSGTAGWSTRRSRWRSFTTMTTSEIATVLAWHDALNERDFDTLLLLSSDDIEVGDAKGATQGHAALLEWA